VKLLVVAVSQVDATNWTKFCLAADPIATHRTSGTGLDYAASVLANTEGGTGYKHFSVTFGTFTDDLSLTCLLRQKHTVSYLNNMLLATDTVDNWLTQCLFHCLHPQKGPKPEGLGPAFEFYIEVFKKLEECSPQTVNRYLRTEKGIKLNDQRR
jgi:hypothetical protein